MKFPVFDLHCDTALAILGRHGTDQKSLRSNSGHIDLSRASVHSAYAQCFACFTTTWKDLPRGMTVEDVFRAERDAVLSEVQRNADMICMAGSAQEVEENAAQGVMSAILTIEGPAGFGFDPEQLAVLYDQGFRISTLTWNEKNSLAGSHVTGGGLTDRGRVYVRNAQQLGMLIDVSHLSDEAFWDLMDITQAPIIATHSNSRAVCGHSRNLSDDMFRQIARTGGVCGINLYTAFLGSGSVTVNTVCDHVLHFLELDPDASHIALGGDLDGCEALPEGIRGIGDYQLIAEALLRRGLDEKTVRKIYWDNAIGVMNRAVCHHEIRA